MARYFLNTYSFTAMKSSPLAYLQNIPNPFNSGSSISYELINEAKYVVLTITDVMGRIISSEQTAHAKGIHTINIKQFSAGLYYYSLNVDGKVITKKMIAQ